MVLAASITMSNKQAVSGYTFRLEWLVNPFHEFAKRADEKDELRSVAGWYLKYGFNIGIKREDLLTAVSDSPDLMKLLQGITAKEIREGKPLPKFSMGTEVEVIVNAKNMTYHKGMVRGVIWHHKNEERIHPAMSIYELVIEMKLFERRLTLYEEKYGILSEDLYEVLMAGKLRG